jgi:hypothetical protein
VCISRGDELFGGEVGNTFGFSFNLTQGDTTMIKSILTVAVLFGTASAALANGEYDSANPLNRYPAYNMTIATQAPALQSRNVALGQPAKSGQQIWIDRASQVSGF